MSTRKKESMGTNRRRLMREAAELGESSIERDGLTAAPLEDDLFEWHWTVQGPPGTEFDGGLYHGRLVLPPEYPFKPPELYVLTPSGRFETNAKICLSISNFHPESWQPSWGVRTALVALTAYFGQEAKGAVGGLDAPVSERKRLARLSKSFRCLKCGYDAAAQATVAAESQEQQQQPEPTRQIADSLETTTPPTSLTSAAAAAVVARDKNHDGDTNSSDRAFLDAGDTNVPLDTMSPDGPGHHHHHHHHHHYHHSTAVSVVPQSRRQASNETTLQQQQHPQQQQQQQQLSRRVASNHPVAHGQDQHDQDDDAEAGRRAGAAAAITATVTIDRGPAQRQELEEPLWTDRAILIVLFALVACVVRKISLV